MSNPTKNHVVHAINQQAQDVIDHTVKRKQKCKLQVVSELFQSVNRICEEEGLEYFAMGKLLTLCMTGEDSYPEDFDFDIGMLRKDYERFLEKISSYAKTDHIQVKPIYHSSGVLQRMTTYLVKHRRFHFDQDIIDIELKLYIQPYDILPSEQEERNRYLMEISRENAQYFRLSQRYRYLRRDAGSLNANPMRIPGLIKNKIFLGRKLQKSRKEAGRIFCRYSSLKEPEYIGRIEVLQYFRKKYKDIFPVQRVSLSNVQIMMPACPEKLALLPQEQEKQRIMDARFQALAYFHELCKEHSLSYVAMEDLSIACSHELKEVWVGAEKEAWMLGMLRKDYDKVLELLEQDDSPVRIIRSLEQYPHICSDKVSFCLYGYERQIPQHDIAGIFLLPFDALPADYDDKLSFSNEIKDMSDVFWKNQRYEMGMDYKQSSQMPDSWQLYDQVQVKRQVYNEEITEPEQIFTVFDRRMYSMPFNEIFPSSERIICGQKVSCARNPFFWFVKEDQTYTEYLAAEREKVMKIIDDVSVENQIDYFAMSNLLIGAVIYHDVMPHSDQRNMDIGFLRKDFEAFLQLIREKGTQYGIELHESLDGHGKYPLEVKYITMEGYQYSQARVRLLPFDKVPEDYYLYQGLRDEIDQKNEDYKQLLKIYNFEMKTRSRFPASYDKEKRLYLEQAVPSKIAAEIEKLAQSFNDDDRTDSYMWIAFGKSKIITKQELYPLKRVKFRGIEVNCPRDTSVWQPVLDTELERQVSCIQKADLMLLQEFDKICKKLGVGYFVCGGTMLGYMRHNGFIPWDDDVDVAMLRADYDRFLKEAGPLLPDGFFLQTRETDPNIPYLFSKIRLDNTEYITKYNEVRDYHKGICLDIFPFDYLPEDEKERKRFVDEVDALAKAHHLIARRQMPIPEKNCIPRNEQESRYMEEQKALLESYWKKDLAVSQKAYLDAATRYNSRAEELGLRTVASFVPSYTFIELGDLLPYQRGQFENIEVSVPKRPDIFLEMQYGNYMQLPPKHMQVAHRLLRWSTWEASGSAAGSNA